MADPCDECKTIHDGECVPVRVQFSLPAWLHDLFVDSVPWGQRSRLVSRLIAEHLEAK